MKKTILISLLAALAVPVWSAEFGDTKGLLEEAQRSQAPEAPPTKPLPVPENLACRFAERVYSGENMSSIAPLIDVNLNTRSAEAKDRCFETTLSTGRKLGACLQEVKIRLPRDRFNVTVFLDGRRHVRSGHMDLDIYLEMDIDGRFYILHCMPEPDI